MKTRSPVGDKQTAVQTESATTGHIGKVVAIGLLDWVGDHTSNLDLDFPKKQQKMVALALRVSAGMLVLVSSAVAFSPSSLTRM
jgi:hypothetical protein